MELTENALNISYHTLSLSSKCLSHLPFWFYSLFTHLSVSSRRNTVTPVKGDWVLQCSLLLMCYQHRFFGMLEMQHIFTPEAPAATFANLKSLGLLFIIMPAKFHKIVALSKKKKQQPTYSNFAVINDKESNKVLKKQEFDMWLRNGKIDGLLASSCLFSNYIQLGFHR